MRFSRWSVDAFRGFRGDFTIPVDGGLVFVEGENRDWGPAAGSNASGKSMAVVETLFWALSGRMVRYPRRPIVTDEATHPTRGAKVTVEVNGYTITRSRTPKGNPKLTMTHQDPTLSRDPRMRSGEVANILGFDARAFQSAVIVSGQAAFVGGAWADQMAVLGAILRLDEFGEAQARSAEAARTLRPGVTALADQRRALQSRLDQVTEELRQVPDLDAARAKIAEEVAALETLDAELVGLRERQAAAESLSAKLNGRVADLVIRQADLNKDIQAKERALASTVCPTCGRPWKTLDHEAQWREQVAVLRAEAEQTVRDKLAADQKRQAASREADRYRREVVDREARIATKASLSESLLALTDAARQQAHQRQRLGDEREALQVKLAALQVESMDQTRLLTCAEFWAKHFGRDYIQAEVVAQALPVLNEAAARYSQALTGGQLLVSYQSFREGRTDDLIRVSGTSAPTVEGLSFGERQRVVVISALALRWLARWRLPEPVNLAIFDETFDGLDRPGLEAVARLLQEEVDAGSTVFVVSHNPTLKEIIPHTKTLRVVRQGGEAEVVWG